MRERDLRAALLRAVVGQAGPAVPDAATWQQWTTLARMEHLTPSLYRLVDTVPTDLSDWQREEIGSYQRVVLGHCLLLEHHLLAVAALLGDHGIASVVLKGGATAHLDYPDPSWRQFTDIDLLVDTADRVAAVELLEREGWIQGYALPRGHEQYAHAVTLARDPIELDLHQRIGRRALGLRVPAVELMERSISYEIAGNTLHALDEINRLIHAALHAISSRGAYGKLSSVADVLVMADAHRHFAGDALARAERWRVRPLVEHAVMDAYATAQLEVPAPWAAAMRSPTRRRDRLVERAYCGGKRRPLAEELAYMRLLPGCENRWRYVRGYFGLSAQYADQFGRSDARAQARYLLSRLRSRSS